jgi:hypothetical protein
VRCPRRDHAGDGGRHLGSQRDLSPALVLEVVELADNLVAALLRVELEGLEGRPVVLRKREPARDTTPRAENVRSFGELGGIEVAKSG